MNTPESRIFDIIIIGAGVSGLSAAAEIRRRSPDRRVVVLDKGRGIGGRAATRRLGEARLDHGTPTLGAWLPNTPGGVTAALKSLVTLHGIEVRLSQKVQSVAPINGGESSDEAQSEVNVERSSSRYAVRIEDSADPLLARTVILTAPAPQAAALIRPMICPDLNSIEYDPALVGLFVVNEDSAEAHWPTASGGRVVSQSLKGTSLVPALVCTMPAEWSRQRFDEPDADILKAITEDFLQSWRSQIIDRSPTIDMAELKKWRYARVQKGVPAPFLALSPGLFYAGDACQWTSDTDSKRKPVEPFIESTEVARAYSSGRAAADACF